MFTMPRFEILGMHYGFWLFWILFIVGFGGLIWWYVTDLRKQGKQRKKK